MPGRRYTMLTLMVGSLWWWFDAEVGSVIIFTALGQRMLEYIADHL